MLNYTIFFLWVNTFLLNNKIGSAIRSINKSLIIITDPIFSSSPSRSKHPQSEDTPLAIFILTAIINMIKREIAIKALLREYRFNINIKPQTSSIHGRIIANTGMILSGMIPYSDTIILKWLGSIILSMLAITNKLPIIMRSIKSIDLFENILFIVLW